MKERIFHLRYDLDPGANIRRLHAYIRTVNPKYTVASRMERKIQARRATKLIRIK